MEEGPASRTRSSLSQKSQSSQSEVNSATPDIFKTPLKLKNRRATRTPSGQQPLTSSVKDIRAFFQQTSPILSNRTISLENLASLNATQTQSTGNQDHLKGSQPFPLSNLTDSIGHEHEISQPLRRVASLTALDVSKHNNCNSNHSLYKQLLQDKSKSETPKGDKVQHFSSLNTASDDPFEYQNQRRSVFVSTNSCGMASYITDWCEIAQSKHAQLQQIEDYKNRRQERIDQCKKQIESEHKQIDTTAQEPTPELFTQTDSASQVMDVKLVVQMFKEIKAEINSGKIPDGEHRVTELEKRQDQQAVKLCDLEISLKEERAKNEMMAGMLISMSEKAKEAERRLEMLELNSMKRSIVVTGINCEPKRDVCLNEIYSFLAEEVAVEVQIDDLFLPNWQSSSPMVITMATLDDKRQIFRNMKNIKGLVNEESKPYIFADYLPQQMNDQKRREREIYKVYDSRGPDSDVKVEWKSGRLQINQQAYKQTVSVPTPQMILNLATADIDELFRVTTLKGDKIQKGDSTFIAYICNTPSTQVIQQAYVKLKLIHADFASIMMGYKIAGINPHECEGYCDDGENGGGRMLLRHIWNNNLENIAIFVARYSGGQKLGKERFTAINEAAKNVADKAGLELDVQQQTGFKLQPKNQRNLRKRANTAPKYRPSLSKQRDSHSRGHPRGMAEGGRGGHPRGMAEGGRGGYMREPRQYRHQAQRDSDHNGYSGDYQFQKPTTVLDPTEWPRIPSRPVTNNNRP